MSDTKIACIDDIACPKCKAQADNGCTTPSGNPCNEPHKARVDAFWKAKTAEHAAEVADEPTTESVKSVKSVEDILTASDYRRAARSRLIGKSGLTAEQKVENLKDAARLTDFALAAFCEANNTTVGSVGDKIKDMADARECRKEAARLLLGKTGLSLKEQAERLALAGFYCTVAATLTHDAAKEA